MAAVAREVEELRDARAMLEKQLEEKEREVNKWKEQYAKLQSSHTKDDQQVPNNN